MFVLRVAAVLSVGLLGLGGLSACSEDEPDGPSSEPSSPSETASPSPEEPEEPTEPEVPEAMANEDKAGAKAFVEYYWAVVEYAQLTGDVSTLKQLSFPSCTACEGGIAEIRALVPKSRQVLGGKMTVSGLSVTPLKSGSLRPFSVNHRVHNTRQVIVRQDGSKETYKASTSRYRFVVRAVGDGAWRVGLIEVLT